MESVNRVAKALRGPGNDAPSGLRGQYGRDKDYVTNVRPFWVSPLNILPHNIYYATQVPIVDYTIVTGNMMALAGAMTLSLLYPKGPTYMFALFGGLWLLWLVDIPSGVRSVLSSREISSDISKSRWTR